MPLILTGGLTTLALGTLLIQILQWSRLNISNFYIGTKMILGQYFGCQKANKSHFIGHFVCANFVGMNTIGLFIFFFGS